MNAKVAVALVGLLVASMGCQMGPATGQNGTSSLLTAPPPSGGAQCLQALVQGTLQADPSVEGAVWLARSDGATVRLRWPHGFDVHFTRQGAQVLGPSGDVVARQGDRVELGGGAMDGTFEICALDGELLL